MPNTVLKQWCKIQKVDGVTFCFYTEWDPDEDEDVLHCITRTSEFNIDISSRKSGGEFTQAEFDKATSEEAVTALTNLLEVSSITPIKD